MTTEERRSKIIELIEKNDYCSVEQLSDAFGVSHMTIRRDLTFLVDEEKILRCRGGAGAIKFNNVTIPSFSIRELHGTEEKKAMSEKASNVLKPGSIIFIDHSSSVLPLLKYITQESGITVVTNGLRVITELSERKIPLYCTGGEYHNLEKAYFGKDAISVVNSLHFDAAFISPRGIVPGDCAYFSSLHETELLTAVMNNSQSKYAVVTHAKIGDKYKHKLCNVFEFTDIFTKKTNDRNIIYSNPANCDLYSNNCNT